jgi:hypothetical protein
MAALEQKFQWQVVAGSVSSADFQIAVIQPCLADSGVLPFRLNS